MHRQVNIVLRLSQSIEFCNGNGSRDLPQRFIGTSSRISNLNIAKNNTLSPTRISLSFLTNTREKHTIDKSRIPVLKEEDLDEEFIKGGGPGGSNVNKTVSCVMLKHKPTGIFVKCQFSRLLHQNREIARQLLQERLDDHLNGEMSINAQKRKWESKKSSEHVRKSKKIDEMKEKYRELITKTEDNQTTEVVEKRDDIKLTKQDEGTVH